MGESLINIEEFESANKNTIYNKIKQNSYLVLKENN